MTGSEAIPRILKDPVLSGVSTLTREPRQLTPPGPAYHQAASSATVPSGSLGAHDPLAGFAILDGTLSTRLLGGTLLCRSHSAASALLRHSNALLASFELHIPRLAGHGQGLRLPTPVFSREKGPVNSYLRVPLSGPVP